MSKKLPQREGGGKEAKACDVTGGITSKHDLVLLQDGVFILCAKEKYNV